MPALNYKEYFVPLIESGAKRQTIRALRKDGRDPKPGDVLYHYTGMRTKRCRKLLEARCLSAEEIHIYGDRKNIYQICIELGNLGMAKLSASLVRELVTNDGFDDFMLFHNFFYYKYGFPFYGLLIKW